MSAELHKKNKYKYWRVTEIKELFFYTLYQFHAYWNMGHIDANAAKKIYNFTHRNLINYKIVLRSNELLHFLYRHFVEGNQKQRGIHIQDIEKLPKVVNNLSFVQLEEDDKMIIKTQFPNSETFVLVLKIDIQKQQLLGKSFWIET